MAIENNRLASMVVGTDRADGGGPLLPGEGDLLPAALIATKLRAAGIECEIFNLVPTKAAVLRRDRIVIILAVALLTVLAWSYLLWLSADMNMGGMDMTGLRMIPSGMGLMVPTDMPWRAMEFAFVFAMLDRDDGRHDDAVGDANVSHVRPCWPTNRHAGHGSRCNGLVRRRLFPDLGRFRAVCHIGAMGAPACRFARFHHGKHEPYSWRVRVCCGWPLPMDPTE
jgi:hypothetical protein